VNLTERKATTEGKIYLLLSEMVSVSESFTIIVGIVYGLYGFPISGHTTLQQNGLLLDGSELLAVDVKSFYKF
jgi:hypothetical protein